MPDNEKFKSIRLNKKLNQQQMADALEMDQTSISAIEKGKSRVTRQLKLLMKYVFLVNPQYWDGAEEMFLEPENSSSYIDSEIIKDKEATIKAMAQVIDLQKKRIEDLEIFRDMIRAQLPATRT